LNLKLLLKRGALLAAANWPVVAIQFIAETTFQALLAVPIIGAAILVAVLLGGDLAVLLGGSLREIFATVTATLMSEPIALVSFILAFGIVLVGGSALMFLVKGGTIDVMLAANEAAGPIEREPLTYDGVRSAAAFTLARFVAGCSRLFRPYLTLGVALMFVYAASGGAYLALLVYGYHVAEGRALVISWTFIAALAAAALVVWITLVNLLYLLTQIVIAVEGVRVGEAFHTVGRFVRAERRALSGVFAVVFAVVVAATFVSALAWSGVGLVAFVPLIGLAVFPLQVAALVIRGLVFEYVGLTAMGAYVTLYEGHAPPRAATLGRPAAPVMAAGGESERA
jgi:hypothetical protein